MRARYRRKLQRRILLARIGDTKKPQKFPSQSRRLLKCRLATSFWSVWILLFWMFPKTLLSRIF